MPNTRTRKKHSKSAKFIVSSKSTLNNSRSRRKAGCTSKPSFIPITPQNRLLAVLCQTGLNTGPRVLQLQCCALARVRAQKPKKTNRPETKKNGQQIAFVEGGLRAKHSTEITLDRPVWLIENECIEPQISVCCLLNVICEVSLGVFLTQLCAPWGRTPPCF